jgi:hypothetical protein
MEDPDPQSFPWQADTARTDLSQKGSKNKKPGTLPTVIFK